jgi:mono/diheme cytochrome c family protein
MRLKLAIGVGILLVAVIISCQDDKSIEFARYYSGGSIVYQNHCQNCHGAHGEGLGALIPPLYDSAFLKKNLHQLPCILQNGLKGKLKVSHKDFDGDMPATGLAPIEIAQALTFAANSFGNKLGLLNTDSVNADLLKCK